MIYASLFHFFGALITRLFPQVLILVCLSKKEYDWWLPLLGGTTAPDCIWVFCNGFLCLIWLPWSCYWWNLVLVWCYTIGLMVLSVYGLSHVFVVVDSFPLTFPRGRCCSSLLSTGLCIVTGKCVAWYILLDELYILLGGVDPAKGLYGHWGLNPWSWGIRWLLLLIVGGLQRCCQLGGRLSGKLVGQSLERDMWWLPPFPG